jgi:hypothetical protein
MTGAARVEDSVEGLFRVIAARIEGSHGSEVGLGLGVEGRRTVRRIGWPGAPHLTVVAPKLGWAAALIDGRPGDAEVQDEAAHEGGELTGAIRVELGGDEVAWTPRNARGEGCRPLAGFERWTGLSAA